jgi:hypothetical protein
MLQIDHVYEFLYQEIFRDFEVWHCFDGVINPNQVNISDISVFTPIKDPLAKIFFYDQEPFITKLSKPYIDIFTDSPWSSVLVTSEYSRDVDDCVKNNNFQSLYYFFHGFAAQDWYRGYYALNYNKPIIKNYKHDFISFNRIINDDRSYRIYFISLLKERGIIDSGQISFNVTDDHFNDWRDEVADPQSKLSDHAKHHIEKHLIDIFKLTIDKAELPGSASANIPRTINRRDYNNDTPNYDSLWHVVTETVFYYNKLHLTEKIFKPIVSKQPFMLLAAPGNLEYLRSYGFKTFDGIIDESYDLIQDNDLRTEAVVKQLHWYCNLTPDEKTNIIQQLEPIIDYNFHHFYGEFKHIITSELLNNTKKLFKDFGYNDKDISYDTVYNILIK